MQKCPIWLHRALFGACGVAKAIGCHHGKLRHGSCRLEAALRGSYPSFPFDLLWQRQDQSRLRPRCGLTRLRSLAFHRRVHFGFAPVVNSANFYRRWQAAQFNVAIDAAPRPATKLRSKISKSQIIHCGAPCCIHGQPLRRSAQQSRYLKFEFGVPLQ